jgi:hypothetical protein
LCSSHHLVLRARHGLLKSLVRGVVKQDAVSQFSRPLPQRRSKKGYLHLLRAVRSENEHRDLSSWLKKKPDAIRFLLRNLSRQNAYDYVLIDARYASKQVCNAAVFASRLAAMPITDTMAPGRWMGRLVPLPPVLAGTALATHSDTPAPARKAKTVKVIPPPKLAPRCFTTHLEEALNRAPAWSYHGEQLASERVTSDEISPLLDLDDDVAWKAVHRVSNPAPQSLLTPICARNVFELPDVLLDAPAPAMPEDIVAWIDRCARGSRLVRESLNKLLPDHVRVWMPTSYPLAPGLQLRAFVAARPAKNVRKRAVSLPHQTTDKGGSYAVAMAL